MQRVTLSNIFLFLYFLTFLKNKNKKTSHPLHLLDAMKSRDCGSDSFQLVYSKHSKMAAPV